jgi:hypothetical protein
MFSLCRFELLIQITKGFLYKTKKPMKLTNFVLSHFITPDKRLGEPQEKEQKGR